jgi:hypothetical protein
MKKQFSDYTSNMPVKSLVMCDFPWNYITYMDSFVAQT